MDEFVSSTDPTSAAAPDKRIGSYRILSPLGSGGMSSVFLAVHVETNHQVALKVLTRALARNANLLQRFFREARSAETLQHPNIVTIYDRGIDHGRHYLVLEYVAGGDLHDHIQAHGPLSLVEAIGVVRGVAAGLNYAAGRGVIHRDIKPSNILRTLEGQVKIIDLGLALQGEFEDERVTREGTTVGTVDYMAPEQARDSRATSVRSDIYSLGCTFYYLLAGIPPFPGGDITDKLTRHVKTPPPDIRDLLPDIPVEVTEIIQKMMAKQPEDRFASYDELTAALDAVPLDAAAHSAPIALMPLLETTVDGDAGAPPLGRRSRRNGDEFAKNDSSDLELHVAPLGDLVADELTERMRERPPLRPVMPEPPLPRQSQISAEESESDAIAHDATEPAAPAKGSVSASTWMVSGAIIGVVFVILAIGVIQFLVSLGTFEDVAPRPAPATALTPSVRPVPSQPRPSVAAVAPANRAPGASIPRAPVSPKAAPAERARWIEPEDADPAPLAAPLDPDAGSKYLPDWARAPIPERISGPLVVVRRITPSNDHAASVPQLYMALDQKTEGTVELADEGPLFVHDLRVAGETRLIRARKGYRSIVQIERSSSESARGQTALLVLDRKNLTLEGLDLIVNLRDLSPSQTSLFSCTGGSLTLKNCSITILNNRGGSAFTVFRARSSGSQPARIRLEESLVRGEFTDGFDLARGPTELVLRKSVVLGGSGPLIRVADAGDGSDRRVFLVHSVLAAPGPIIDLTRMTPGRTIKALALRAYGSALGRWHGAGIASVISSADPVEPAKNQIDWAGDHNLLAGWKGFFAGGNDHTVMVADLAAIRGTWNAADRESQEILAPWTYPLELAIVTPVALVPFLSNREAILWQVAHPRAGLFEKTIATFRAPAIPEPVGWAFERAVDARSAADSRPNPTTKAKNAARADLNDLELTFNTEMLPWKGDLGAFLNDQLTAAVTGARVRVVGSGSHPFSPVRLPRGIQLEIRVEPYSRAEPPSWSPAPQTTGPALIELHEGALVMANVVLRHDKNARVERLIHVEDGWLVLSRCQLTSSLSPAEATGDLIEFRATTTQPRPSNPGRPLFSETVDRPVCRLVDSLLITGGNALKAELGRGLVALSECAVAAGEAAIDLVPSKVARQRFEADLILDHCTLTAERSIIRVLAWPGRAPGPDRPWLVTSRNCAFLAMYDRPTRETVLLRADADALASGTVFWQAANDAADVDCFIAAGEGPPPSSRNRDVQNQWNRFWGNSHIRNVDGPRGTGSAPTVRFRDKLRPGRVAPADLILDPDYHPGRSQLDQGADLGRQGLGLPLRPERGPY
jgi:serine/threonine-protein kinase